MLPHHQRSSLGAGAPPHREPPARGCSPSPPWHCRGGIGAAGSSASARRRGGLHVVAPQQPLQAAAEEVGVLGGEDFIYSQQSGVSEELYKGDVLGVYADVASGGFRQTELRSLAHLPDDLAPPDRFLDRVAVHVAKNALSDRGSLRGRVPLVMGVWGHKGAGKTFNLELCCRVLGVAPVIMSAGEMEDEWAGAPGKRLRDRYLFAARHAASTGDATCLIINDMDAGECGHVHVRVRETCVCACACATCTGNGTRGTGTGTGREREGKGWHGTWVPSGWGEASVVVGGKADTPGTPGRARLGWGPAIVW